MQFKENFVLQFPSTVIEDQELSWMHRLAFSLFYHFKGDSKKVCSELGMTDRGFRKIKAKLSERGHIARTEDAAGQVKYLPIDVNVLTWEKIRKFREVSTEGFKLVKDENIIALQSNHSLQYILRTMEILEWTYRKSKHKRANKIHHVLAAVCKKGPNPDADYIPGFWEKNITPKKYEHTRAEPKKKANAENDEDRAQRIERDRQRNLDEIYRLLPAEDRERIRSAALREIKNNGGLPSFKPAAERMIKIHSWQIIEREYITGGKGATH